MTIKEGVESVKVAGPGKPAGEKTSLRGESEDQIKKPITVRNRVQEVSPGAPVTHLKKSSNERENGSNNSNGFRKVDKSPEEASKHIPHYLRPSTGSCHHYCKYGVKPEAPKHTHRHVKVPRNTASSPTITSPDAVKSPVTKTHKPSKSISSTHSPVRSSSTSVGVSSKVSPKGKTAVNKSESQVKASSAPLKSKTLPSALPPKPSPELKTKASISSPTGVSKSSKPAINDRYNSKRATPSPNHVVNGHGIAKKTTPPSNAKKATPPSNARKATPTNSPNGHGNTKTVQMSDKKAIKKTEGNPPRKVDKKAAVKSFSPRSVLHAFSKPEGEQVNKDGTLELCAHKEQNGTLEVCAHEEENGTLEVSTHKEENGTPEVFAHKEDNGTLEVCAHKEEKDIIDQVCTHKKEMGIIDQVCANKEEMGIIDQDIIDQVCTHEEEMGIIDQVCAHKEEMGIIDQVCAHKEEMGIIDQVCAHKEEMGIIDQVCANEDEDVHEPYEHSHISDEFSDEEQANSILEHSGDLADGYSVEEYCNECNDGHVANTYTHYESTDSETFTGEKNDDFKVYVEGSDGSVHYAENLAEEYLDQDLNSEYSEECSEFTESPGSETHYGQEHNDSIGKEHQKADHEEGSQSLEKQRFTRGPILAGEEESQSLEKQRFRRGQILDAEEENRRAERRRFRRGRVIDYSNKKPEPENVELRHQEEQRRKAAEEFLLNHKIEEAVNKLSHTRKSKVKTLVGAFETVISLKESEIIEPKHVGAKDSPQLNALHESPKDSCLSSILHDGTTDSSQLSSLQEYMEDSDQLSTLQVCTKGSENQSQ